MNRLSASILCALALAVGAQDIPPARSLSMEAVSGEGPLTTRSAIDSVPPPSNPTLLDATSKPVVDSMDLKQLPPRTLPFRQQMMFAGGFMVFVALMLTSMQNFNPND